MSTVTISSVLAGGQGSITLLLGPTPASISSDGGWSFVDRPKNVGFTNWEGYAPYVMSFNVIFDGLVEDADQELQVERLRKMMRDPAGQSNRPSPVRISGPLPRTDLSWVIQSLEEDPASLVRNDRGVLVRLRVTLYLLEYVEADLLIPLAPPSPAERLIIAVPPPVISSRTYTFKAGDSLWGIAQKELGAGKRYTEIAQLNGIRDPNRVPVGTVLRLP